MTTTLLTSIVTTTRAAVPLRDLVLPVESRGPDSLRDRFTYIDLSSVDAASKQVSSPRTVAVAEAPSRARQRVFAGDVLVSTVRPNLNGVARVPNALNDVIASTGFCVLRADPEILDSKYLYYWVRSDSFIASMSRRATGASYPAVSDSIVKDSEIPLPPLAGQRRIAAILDQAEELRMKRRQTMTLNDELAGSLFDDMNRAASVKVEASFGDLIATVQNGTYVPSSEYGSGTPILRIADFGGGELLSLGNLNRVRISESDANRYALSPNDLLINRVNAMSHVGKSAMVLAVPEPTVFESNMMRIRLRTELVAPEYALAWLQTPNACRQIRSSAKQAINQASVNQTDIASLRISLPGRDVQSDFVERLRELQGLRASQRTHLSTLDELFASLQHRAFTGQL